MRVVLRWGRQGVPRSIWEGAAAPKVGHLGDASLPMERWLVVLRWGRMLRFATVVLPAPNIRVVPFTMRCRAGFAAGVPRSIWEGAAAPKVGHPGGASLPMERWLVVPLRRIDWEGAAAPKVGHLGDAPLPMERWRFVPLRWAQMCAASGSRARLAGSMGTEQRRGLFME